MPFGGETVHAPVVETVAAGKPLACAGRPFPTDSVRRTPVAEGDIVHIDDFGNAKFPFRAHGSCHGDRLRVEVGVRTGVVPRQAGRRLAVGGVGVIGVLPAARRLHLPRPGRRVRPVDPLDRHELSGSTGTLYDLTPRLVDQAAQRARCSGYADRVRFRPGDVRDAADLLSGESFDLVLHSNHLLGFVDDPKAVLASLTRLLSVDGLMVWFLPSL